MKANTPKCANTPDKRKAIGGLLQQLVYAGIQQKGDVEAWWARCEQDHRNEWNEDSAPGTGLTPLHIPFTQPRVDTLTAQVCTTIGRQTPYMIADGVGASDDQETRLQQLIHKFWEAAGFEMNLRRASAICVDTNKVWYRVAWERNDRKAYGGVILDVIHPKHVCIFPATLAGIESARLVGHRFYRRRKSLMAMQKAGTYFDDADLTYGDSPQEYDTDGEIANSGAAPSVSGPDPNDGLVECWDVVFQYEDPDDEKSGEKWYRATFAFKQQVLLSIDPYPYSRPWYFDAAYVVGNEDAYWSGISVSRHLSGLQDATNKASAAIYNGSMMTAFPAVWGPELPQKDARYGYGEYIPTDSPLQNWAPSITFKGDALAQMVQGIDLVGDKVSRISANSQGALQARDSTATESSLQAAGTAVGTEEYIANFSAPLRNMAEFTIELMGKHMSEWAPIYGPIFGLQPQDLAAPMVWSPNGASPGNSPGAKLAAVEKLADMLKTFGPATGLDPYSLTQAAIANLGFSGGDNLQISKEQMIAQQQQQQAAQQPGTQPPAGPLPPPGMAGAPGLPPAAAGPGPAPMLPPGPPG